MSKKKKYAPAFQDMNDYWEQRKRRNSIEKFGKQRYELDMFYSGCGVRIIGVRYKDPSEGSLRRWG